MKVRALTEIPTAKGIIPAGQIVEIPESVMVKLKGKVAEITPVVDYKCSAKKTAHISKDDHTPEGIVDPVAPARTTWPLEMQSLVEWFSMQEAPAEPFYLEPHLHVTDPVKYFHSLRQEIHTGPKTPRARTGALQSDLRKLKTYLNGAK